MEMPKYEEKNKSWFQTAIFFCQCNYCCHQRRMWCEQTLEQTSWDQFLFAFDDSMFVLRCLLPMEIKSMLLQFLFITVSKAFKSKVQERICYSVSIFNWNQQLNLENGDGTEIEWEENIELEGARKFAAFSTSNFMQYAFAELNDNDKEEKTVNET